MTRKIDRPAGERIRRALILANFAAILWVCSLPTHAQQAPAPAPTADAAAVSPGNDSSRWPLLLNTPSGQITVYQPQLTNFDGDKMTARAAVSVIAPGQQDPTFGAIWMESRVATDRVARTVQILDVTVTKVRFPDANGPTEQSLTDAMRATLPQQPMTLSLDSLLSMLEVVQKEKAAVKEISNDVPQILFRDHASVLVRFDGDPRLEQVPNSNLLRAVNTPFFVVLDPASKTYYLKGGGQWFAANQTLGPYANVTNVPGNLAQAADAMGYKDPQEALSPAQAAGIEIVTTTVPSELIWTDGPEQMQTIDGTDLLYVANTDCDIFLHIDTQTIYILVSGRWFSAPHRTGPWTFVPPDKLPDDFSRIPADSAKGDVLAHVANTQAAKDAVADTFVPQTAAISRSNYEQPEVIYDGDPDFEPVADTSISYCVNTPDSILLVDHRYYSCYHAVWYSCDQPHGNWLLCDHVPDVIYTLPPSCPLYPCRYVYVYDATPDVIYCGYLPGYVGCYHWDGVVVYGTGYYYRPWYGHTYYPRPYTYGFDAHYDAYNNRWGFGIGLAFGGGDAWFRQNGDHDHHDDWFGHGGWRPNFPQRGRELRGDTIYRTHIENHTYNETIYNVYNRRTDVHYDVNARPELRSSAHTVAGRNDIRAPENRGQPAAAGRGFDSRDNVYSDSNGNVYRKTLDGWERREGNQWKSADVNEHASTARPTESPRDAAQQHNDAGTANRAPEQREEEHPAAQRPEEPDRGGLDRDFRARVEGEERARSEAPPEPPRAESPRDDHPDSHSGGDSRDGGGSSGAGRSEGGSRGGGQSDQGNNGNGNSRH
jgi:hypothetical protein